jgi:hypothetical protein
MVWLGLKTIGNGRENTSTVTATVFFERERERERESRTGKRNRYYGILGTGYYDREHVDYDQEQVNTNGKTDICNPFKHSSQVHNTAITTMLSMHTDTHNAYIVVTVSQIT